MLEDILRMYYQRTDISIIKDIFFQFRGNQSQKFLVGCKTIFKFILFIPNILSVFFVCKLNVWHI